MQRVNDKAVVFLPWDTIEPAAQQQILNIASMPFVFKHVAVMPECHYGKGATVGTVLATSGAVIPAAVGVDIGCGMIAVRTRLKRADIPDARKVRAHRRRARPDVGTLCEGNQGDPRPVRPKLGSPRTDLLLAARRDGRVLDLDVVRLAGRARQQASGETERQLAEFLHAAGHAVARLEPHLLALGLAKDDAVRRAGEQDVARLDGHHP